MFASSIAKFLALYDDKLIVVFMELDSSITGKSLIEVVLWKTFPFYFFLFYIF